jgi:DUF1016 N-terminal domain
MNNPLATEPVSSLITELRQLIKEARQSAVEAVNAGLTLMFWRIDERLRGEVLKGVRAEYGAQIVSTLSKQLVLEFGRAFEEKNLRRMVQFSEVFTDEAIVVSLTRQLSWSHFLVLIPLKDAMARDFYAQMCCMERWSVRTLRDRVGSLLFERTALSQKTDELIRLELDALHNRGMSHPRCC